MAVYITTTQLNYLAYIESLGQLNSKSRSSMKAVFTWTIAKTARFTKIEVNLDVTGG